MQATETESVLGPAVMIATWREIGVCGFTGELRFDGAEGSTELVARMADRLAARGPDGSGLFKADGLVLAHRRLKVMDLGDASHQPMVASREGFAVAFNGAIYNYRELRAELRGLGHRFSSDGDTEVLLGAYQEWGTDCVEHLDGMFAFVIWDRDRNSLVMARDHLGIKPLYIAETDGRLLFASTLPALLEADGIDDSIDPVALHHYLNFHGVVPPPRTILRGVRKLPAATIRTIDLDSGRSEERRWWRHPSPAEDTDMEPEEASVLVLDALRLAVQKRLEADVPVGALLSGGLDSSLLVALIAEAAPDRLETFSIGFESRGELAGDEFRWSDTVADRYGTKHRKIRISDHELREVLPGCLAAMSEPMVSHDAVGFYLLSREVARSVKVVQSGQGADEVFGGYHWYPRLSGSRRPAFDYGLVFRDGDQSDFEAATQVGFHAVDHSAALIETTFSEDPGRDPVDQALHIDTTVMLVDDPVKRVDNMTMAFGLEARVPFLDRNLVETAARIPWRLKVANGGKKVLKDAARAHLPAEIVDRPKGYFPVPALSRLHGPPLELVRDILGSNRARARGVFAPAYVDELLADPEGRMTPLGGSRLWQIATLELWLQLQGR